MSRPSLFRTDHFAYHVYSRSNNREFFELALSTCWNFFTSQLAESAERYGIITHAFVLMANHFHLLLMTPNKNLDAFMRHFLTEVSRAIQRRTGTENHLFGGRYRWTVLESPQSFAYALKYVYRNPVRAGICERVEDYAFTTLLPGKVPVAEGFGSYWKRVPRDFDTRLAWLNVPTPKEQEELIRKALRRYRFSFSSGAYAKAQLQKLKEGYGVE